MPTDMPLGGSVRSLGKTKITAKAITGAANNGAGLIRITSVAHGLSTDGTVVISGVTGTTEANGRWKITKITADTYDLQGSAFVNVYVAGGVGTTPVDVFGNFATLRNLGGSGSGLHVLRAYSWTVQALPGNTGTLWVGVRNALNRVTGDGVIVELTPGLTLSESLIKAQNAMALGDIELDVNNNGDGFYASYTPF